MQLLVVLLFITRLYSLSQSTAQTRLSILSCCSKTTNPFLYESHPCAVTSLTHFMITQILNGLCAGELHHVASYHTEDGLYSPWPTFRVIVETEPFLID